MLMNFVIVSIVSYYIGYWNGRRNIMGKQMKFTEVGNKKKYNLMIVDGLNIAFRWRYKKVPYYTNDYVRTVESLAKSYNCGNTIILADGGSVYR